MKEKKEYDSFIFTHIPKCGGTSFRKLINDSAIESGISSEKLYIPGFNGLGNDKNFDQLNEEELNEFKNETFKVMAAHSKFNIHKKFNLKINKPFYYTILREPVERFISHYHFFYYTLGYNKLKGVHLNELPEDNLIFLVNKLANIQTDYLASFKFKKVIGDENLLKLAKYNLQYEYSAFGMIHNMDRSLEYLKLKLPKWISIESEIKILNKSNSSTHEINDFVRRIILDNNQLDVELLKFSEALFEQRGKAILHKSYQ